jgi:hypothetical protein
MNTRFTGSKNEKQLNLFMIKICNIKKTYWIPACAGMTGVGIGF